MRWEPLFAGAALCAWSIACGGRSTPPKASDPPPAAAAANEPQVVRFPRLDPGAEDARGYKVAHRMRVRLTDVATGQIAEQGSSLQRTEITRPLASGGVETEVVGDLETRGVMPVTPIVRPSYTVTTVGQNVTVKTRDGAPLDPAYEKAIVERSRARGALAEVVDVLSQGAFVEGKAVALPPSFLALVAASATGRATLVAVEQRWQRRVAHLAIEISRPETAEMGAVNGEGDLYVEMATGRPISLATELRTSRRWKEQGRDVEARGVEVSYRRWGFHSRGAHAGFSFSADPAPSVTGEARQIAIAPDERLAAVLMERPTGNELAIWDLGRRSVLESRASTARFVMVEAAGAASTMVHEVGRVDVTSRVRTDGGMQAFGSVLLMDMSFEPSAAAATGPWVAVGATDGRVLVADPRYGCMRGAFRSGLASIRAMAFPSQERLVLVDDHGEVEVLALQQVGAAAPHQRACENGAVRSSRVERFKLAAPVARVDAHAGALLFVTAAGDATLQLSGGPRRSLGTIGTEATLTRAADGGAPVVTTRSAATEPAPAAIAIGRSGRIGVTATRATLSLFVPGSARDAARLETTASLPSGAVLHGGALVAASNDAAGSQALTWNLATASARAERLGPAATTLSGTADGSRHVLTSADRVEVRETRTGAVVRRWAGPALGAGGVSGAALGRAGSALALRRGDGAVSVRDVASGRTILDLPAGSAAGPSSFALSPADDLVLAVGSGGRLVATELPAGRVRFDVEATRPATAMPGKHIAVSSDGAWIAIAGTSRDGTPWNPGIPVVEIRSTRDGALVMALSPTWDDVGALAFSADRTLLFGGSVEGRLLTWDTASGQLVADREAHARAITSLFAPASGDALVSASTDGSVRLWHPRAIEDPRPPVAGAPGILEEAFVPWRPIALVATLMVDARGDAVAATGDGYYKADRGSLRTLALTSGFLRYEFQQFDALLHRPDLVVERLGAGGGDDLVLFRAAHAKREKLLRGAIPRSLPDPPQVTVAAPLPLVAAEREVALDLRVTAGTGALRALHVAVNSVPVGPVGGTPLSGPRWSGSIPLVLGAGANRVDVHATDERGAASQIESHVIEYTGPTQPPSLYAVVIGVSRYADRRFDLDYAAKDAVDVGTVLASSKRFARVHVHRILDERATRANIMAARAFLEQAGVDDTVVVFLAGHGLLDRKLDYYFATHDIDPRDPARAGLGYGDLTALITGLAARRRLVLIDTCHAGEADKEAAAWTPPAGIPTRRHVKRFRGLRLVRPVPDDQSFGLMLQLFTDLRGGSGAIVVGSAGGAELALESSRYRNGVFTFALLEALEQNRGDVDRSGDVSATELVRYLRTRVVALTQGAQRPATRGENLDLDFPIY